MAKQEIQKKATYERKVLEYKEKIEHYEKRLLTREKMPSLLEAVSDMAIDSGIRIVAITPVMLFKTPVAGEEQPYREIPIWISARSGYHQLGSFINSLENAHYFMKVADIQIRSNKRTPARHDVELLIVTYVLSKEE